MNAKPWSQIKNFDPEVASLIDREFKRQQHGLEMIASENFASIAVITAMANVFTNKYAEGLPKKRYYGGCNVVDDLEELCITRACQLFDAKFANVQPHSGSQANAAVYMALLQPGDTLLGMNLAHGGHLTHGSKVNFSGRLYNSVFYGVHSETGAIDYDEMARLALEHRPKLIVGGFSAYSLIVDWARMREIADSVGAYFTVDMAHVAGLVAAGVYPSPLPYADVVTTTTHKTLRGPRGGMILAKANPELEKKFNSFIFPGTQGGPLMHVIAAKAVALLEALQPDFKLYQRQVVHNAQAMASIMSERGYKIVSGRTENHLFLLDLIDQTLTGKEFENLLDSVHITVNKNAVPNDPRSPMQTSGLRIGTPAITTRGMGENEAKLLASWIADVLDAPSDQAVLSQIKTRVISLCADFPVYTNKA